MILTPENLDNTVVTLNMVVQRANETEDQSEENLAAIGNIFMKVVEHSNIVLDEIVSVCTVCSAYKRKNS